RTPLCHAQDADGGNPLPDETPAKGCHRHGTACPRLQSHPRDEHHGHPTPHGSNEGLVQPPLCPTPTLATSALPAKVLTRPRPISDIGTEAERSSSKMQAHPRSAFLLRICAHDWRLCEAAGPRTWLR